MALHELMGNNISFALKDVSDLLKFFAREILKRM